MWIFFSKRNNFVYYITKIFLLYTLNAIASFNFFRFSWFEQSIYTLKFKASAPKASASAFYCFQTCKKITRQFKTLAILYSSRFTIILQQVLLVNELNGSRNFLSKNVRFLCSICIWKKYNKNSLITKICTL